MGESALFCPSISSIYARTLSRDPAKLRNGNLPKGIPSLSHLNFLDEENALFYYPCALYSVGHAAIDLDKSDIAEAMVQKRDRSKTIMIGDSGGYQVATGVLKWPWDNKKEQDDVRMSILKWLEHTSDWSMTLDFPFKALSNEKALAAGMDSEDKCLNGTIENLEFFIKNRTLGATKFLNVLQGRNAEEGDVWYDAVKTFSSKKKHGDRAFEGWAFGGISAVDFELILRRLVIMRDQGLLETTGWLHFLGSGKVHAAPAFTELQRQLRKYNPDMCVSYDAASPFVSVAHGQTYTNFNIDPKRIAIPMTSVVDNKFLTEEARNMMFMHQNSPVGQRLTNGDICVNLTDKHKSAWDGYSYVLLMAHSLYLHLKAIQTVNYMYNVPDESRPVKGRDVKRKHLPTEIFTMRDIIQTVFADDTADPYKVIEDNAAFLQSYMKVYSKRKGITKFGNMVNGGLFKAKESRGDAEVEEFDIDDTINGEVEDAFDNPEFAKLFEDGE